MKKKVIHVRVMSSIDNYLEGKIDEAIKALEGFKERYGEGAYLERYYYDEGSCLQLYVDREETDKEYNSRIKEEKRIQAEQEVRERKEYDRLAKKFGKGN